MANSDHAKCARVLDPVLLMAMNFTGTRSVATATTELHTWVST